jgi:hypothetical protein
LEFRGKKGFENDQNALRLHLRDGQAQLSQRSQRTSQVCLQQPSSRPTINSSNNNNNTSNRKKKKHQNYRVHTTVNITTGHHVGFCWAFEFGPIPPNGGSTPIWKGLILWTIQQG